MRRAFTALLFGGLAFGSLAAPAAFAGDCKLIGGIGNGITEGMAQFMAEKALQNVMENQGRKPSGDITYKCTAAAVGSECTARQQGCK